jgi:nucleotide-binding universal stress UspA family protein
MCPHGLVVGVDGSRASEHALAFAMREAGLRRTGLHVVTVWEARSSAADQDSELSELSEQGRDRAQHVQDVAVATALREVEARPVLKRSVVSGDAGTALCEFARSADYLVVGGIQDASAYAGSLGRVGLFCLRHAACAVVVVPRRAVNEAASQREPRPVFDARARAS